MQLIAVDGSFTAGEIARSAMSTIWSTPNSASCCSVLVGPTSTAAHSASMFVISKIANRDRRFDHDRGLDRVGQIT